MNCLFYLALEGIDGCGKSTVAKQLTDRMKASGINVVLWDFTHIGQTFLGSLMRRLYYPRTPSTTSRFWDSFESLKCLAFLINGCLNRPRSSRDTIVIGDRSPLTLLAMFPRWCGPKWLGSAIIRAVCSRIMPTTTVFLEIAPSKAIERLKRRGPLAPNETEPRLAEIRAEFNSLLRPHNRHRSDLSVVPVCADQDIEEIVVQVANVLATASKKGNHV